jgi:hypothetical protein
MPHHLDCEQARRASRLDITHHYVFRGETGTVFVVEVDSSLAGLDAQRGFRPEARYEFKVHMDGAEQPVSVRDGGAGHRWVSHTRRAVSIHDGGAGHRWVIQSLGRLTSTPGPSQPDARREGGSSTYASASRATTRSRAYSMSVAV